MTAGKPGQLVLIFLSGGNFAAVKDSAVPAALLGQIQSGIRRFDRRFNLRMGFFQGSADRHRYLNLHFVLNDVFRRNGRTHPLRHDVAGFDTMT